MADLDQFNTAIERLRAMIPDVELIPNPNRPGSAPEYMFTDAHLTSILDTAAGNIWRAAGICCDLIATSELIVSKVITTEDLSTDGAKFMNAMSTRAVRYFARADQWDAESDDTGFTIIPFYLDPVQLEWR